LRADCALELSAVCGELGRWPIGNQNNNDNDQDESSYMRLDRRTAALCQAFRVALRRCEAGSLSASHLLPLLERLVRAPST
jgi:hypothetical protein